jgi:aminopeptidase N
MKKTLTILTLLFVFQLNAQDYLERLKTIDVKHYNLSLQVNDSTDKIDATMEVLVRFRKKVEQFELDLVKLDTITNKGMSVAAISQNSISTSFNHEGTKLNITAQHIFPGVDYTYTIKYSGVPKTGLIISENIHGDRTFFADNWPNRAHHWFPCVDHPSDKATIEYTVTAPNHYQVIANGYEVEETNINNDLKQTYYKTEVPLPTKVMVIGIAKFAVQNIGETHNVPVSTWVYPQTKKEGFHDFETAKSVLNFFIEKIGSYPFLKLANVQSKTQYGGMENAGAIFYFEKSVTGQRKHENLIAHEIAHQWFGNATTEKDWPHIWLSEGFATYLTNLYILEKDGEAAFMQRLQNDRKRVLAFFNQNKNPVVNTYVRNYMNLLNPNSYQKGAWVLHMIRNQIGDELFWKTLQTYSDTFKYKNAATNDFKKVLEEVTKLDFSTFFDQWLYKAGHPVLKSTWIEHNNELRLLITQEQQQLFEFTLDVKILYNDGNSETQTVQINTQANPLILKTKGKVKSIQLDPNTNLLFKEVE